MNKDISTIVDNFPKKCILVIGDMMLDRYVDGDVSRISPEGPIPILRVTSTRSVPGGAANTANNIRSLGGKVILSGIIGDDEDGKLLLDELKEQGIDCSCVLVDKTRPTIQKERFVSLKQQLLRVDIEKTHPLSDALGAELMKRILKKSKEFDAIVISDYNKGVLTEKLIRSILKLGKDTGKMVIVDPKPANFRFYAGATIIKPNFKEAQEIIGLTGDNEDRFVENIASSMVKSQGSNVLISRGSKGMTLAEISGKITHIPARKIELRDVSGAGDTLVATLALSLVSGLSMQEAADLSNRASGIAVSKFGTSNVKPEELKSVLSEEIAGYLMESIQVKQAVVDTQLRVIEDITQKMIGTYINKKKILIFGNGGSASDAQHLAGELVGRFKMERKGFPAISLSADTSTITSIGNDYGFERVFERQIEALGNKGDMAVAFTTSGNSLNITNGLLKAREIGMSTVVFTGKDGGKAKEISDLSIIVPSNNTPRIQEVHIALVHIICEILEKKLVEARIVK